MGKRVARRLAIGSLLATIAVIVGFILSLSFQATISLIPENRDDVPFLYGEGSNSPLTYVILAGGWALLCYLADVDIGQTRLRRAIYAALFFVILPVSMVNYAHLDALINKTGQAVLNVVLVFTSLVLVIDVAKTRPNSPDGIVLKLMAVFFMSVGAVVIPAFFSTIWGLQRLGLVGPFVDRVVDAWIAVVSTAVASFATLLAQRTGQGTSKDKKRIITV